MSVDVAKHSLSFTATSALFLIMQASDLLTKAISTQPTSLNYSQSYAHLRLRWVRKRIMLVDAVLAIVGIFGIQQVLFQIYSNYWQISFLFALIGLIIVLMLGQHYLNQIQSRFVGCWTMLSSIIVTTLEIGMVAWILIAPIMA